MARKQVAKKEVAAPVRRTVSRAKKVNGSPAAAAAPKRRRAPVKAAPAANLESAASHEDIARLAYALWESRGGQGGSPDEDWLQAEKILAARG